MAEEYLSQISKDEANHVEMEGVTILQDEEFTLSSGATCKCPGTSGVAAEDCNCRCYVSHQLMTDEEFYNATGRHFDDKAVDNSGNSGIINTKSDTAAQENQRYGRNKDTLVNKTYIEGGEYRRKFDNISENQEVNKTLYSCAKTALKHRSGTKFEDMYWIDGDTGKIITSALNEKYESGIINSNRRNKLLSKYKNVYAIHTHPQSMPPSVADFNSCCANGYKSGYIACHNGKVFGYTSQQIIREEIYNMYIGEYINKGFTEYGAQIKAIEELKKNHNIDFWEVQ